MIQLKPIDEEVQKTLIEKIKQSGKKERPVQEPLSGDKGNYMQSRTTWARMISLSTPKDAPKEPIVISAGEEIIGSDRLSVSEPLTGAGNSQKIAGKLRGEFAEVYQTDNYNRPIAGLKSISTRIQGQTKAIRSADIKWICWDFETLERLTPYFLSPGASIALEFGWMWPGHKPEEFIYNNWSSLNARKIGDLSKVVRKKGKGNQELVYGIVKNFTWTGRDDGGFDCQTEIVSPASSVFGAPLGDSESTAAFEIPADLRNQIRNQRAYFDSRESEVKNIRENVDIQKALKTQGLGTSGEEGSIAKKGGIENLPPKILFENLTEILLDLKYTYADGGVLGAGGDADIFNAIVGEKEEYKDTIIVQRTYRGSNSNFDKAYLGPYVTYGWFEDNILNRFISKVHDGKIGYQIRSVDEDSFEEKDGIKYFESVKINNDTENLLTLNAQEVIIPGQWPMDMEFKKPMQAKRSADQAAQTGEIVSKRMTIMSLAEKVRELPAFSVSPEIEQPTKIGKYSSIKRYAKEITKDKSVKGKGYLRNLLIHSDIIQEEMGRANTLEDGLMNLMKRVSDACGSVWDFKLTTDQDNPFQAKIVEDSSTDQPVKNLLNNKSIDLNTGEVTDNYKNDGLMIFPTWQINSIVYNQNMVTKLPSQMATAAIYGRNLGSAEAAAEDLTLDPAAKAIGKLFNAGLEEPKNPRDVILKNMARIIGNSDYPNFGYNANPEKINGKFLVPELSPDSIYPNQVKGIDINIEKVIQIYTEKQIMEILEDGVPHIDAETGEEKDGVMDTMASWWSDKFIPSAAAVVEQLLPGTGQTLKGIASWIDTWDDFRYLYTEKGVMKKHFRNPMMYFLKQKPDSLQRTKDIMTPIELSLTIDGTGAIFAGEAFSSTYIPGRYRKACVFQIMDVAHELDSAGWKTTLRGLMRIDYGFGEKVTTAEKIKKLEEESPMTELVGPIQSISPKKKEVDGPPYTSFIDYLNKTAGKKESPYRPKKEEKPDTRTQEEIETDNIQKIGG